MMMQLRITAAAPQRRAIFAGLFIIWNSCLVLYVCSPESRFRICVSGPLPLPWRCRGPGFVSDASLHELGAHDNKYDTDYSVGHGFELPVSENSDKKLDYGKCDVYSSTPQGNFPYFSFSTFHD